MWSKRCLCCVSRFCCRVLWSWLTNFWLFSSLFFFHWVVSFLANTVNSTLHIRWEKIVKKVFPWFEFESSVSGFTVLIFWSKNLLWSERCFCCASCFCSGVLLPWIAFSLMIALSNDLFGWVSSLSANIVYYSLHHRTESVRGEVPPKFKLGSFDSASKLLTITP